jgi:hypothetical protein
MTAWTGSPPANPGVHLRPAFTDPLQCMQPSPAALRECTVTHCYAQQGCHWAARRPQKNGQGSGAAWQSCSTACSTTSLSVRLRASFVERTSVSASWVQAGLENLVVVATEQLDGHTADGHTADVCPSSCSVATAARFSSPAWTRSSPALVIQCCLSPLRRE